MTHILIVDDEIGFQSLLTEVLTGARFKTASALSGAEALRLSQLYPFDLLLVDNRMPQMSGVEFLRQFRTFNPDTPVAMMTAFADVAVVVDAMRLGVTEFLVKPFDIEEIVPLVRRCLRLTDAGDPPQGTWPAR